MNEFAVLLDFDGTILRDNIYEPQAQALCAAVEKTFHVPVERYSVDWVGKTDLQLARELLGDRGNFDAGLEAYKENYYREFLNRKPLNIPVREGWLDVLPQLRRECRTALVTGNILSVALAKVSGASLKDEWLGVGCSAYGNDSENRAELVAIALQRTQAQHTILVGDTWRDIEAAHANDIPAIALVTEKHPVGDLLYADWHAHSPEDVLNLVLEWKLENKLKLITE